MPTLSKAFGLAGPCKQSRKLTIALFVLLAICLFGRPAEAQYGGGSGEPNDPYLIYTAEQMNAIGADPNDWDKHFKLMADIDLSAYTGTDFNIIGYYRTWQDRKPFTGVFDGSGHTISNFFYTTTDANNVGLFAYISGAEIKDLGLIDPNVDAGTGNYVGSLVGSVEYRSGITNCYAEGGSVSGNEWVGGLVGENEGKITNCYSTSSVSGERTVGGLVGLNYEGTITNCYSSSSVSGSYNVGGLVGFNVGRWYHGIITNCYATGSVSGDSYVGGLVGDNLWLVTITNCYSSGSVSGGSDVGGLVGKNDDTVSYSFWDIETSGQTTSAGGKGKTTAEMQTESTFTDAGWDFVGQPDGPHDIWAEPAGGGYPILWWQLGPLLGLPSFSGGTGEPDDPYLISTDEDLNSIGHNPRLMEAHFKLINDIDLAGIDFFIIGSNWNFPFKGVFDGNGHTISNFSYTSTDTDYIGLFGSVRGENACIKDLGLIDPNVDPGTANFVGSLVGWLEEGTVTDCHVEGGSVSGNGCVGGLVGDNDSTISNCYSTASVPGNWRVGGLVGDNDGTISNCYSTASVPGNWRVGGLVGANSYGTITDCYSNASVSGVENVGGLVGRNYWGTITDCYSTGSVLGDKYVGGLVGSGAAWGVDYSFWDIESSGLSTSAGGTGKTTAEMQTESTFTDAGWDFLAETVNGTEDIWWILEGQDYPRLWWEAAEP